MRTCIYLFLLLAFTTSCRNKQEAGSLHSPNVLLITIDTLRPDHLSCYGSSNHTPNIDAIAKNGVVFENAFSQVPLTFPSHTSILTGLFPVHHGVHQNGIEIFTKKELLVTNAFRNNGYKAAAIVSSFVLDRKFGLASGFDTYDDQMERLPEITSNFEVERPGNQVVDHATKILDSLKGGKWFLWLHFYDPHTPYAPPAPLKGYDGEITFVDQQIGKLRQWLKQKKLDQNLIIVIMGDHGESLGEHGEATHGYFVYNSTLRIPLILSYPGLHNQRVTQPAAAVDVTPTLLQLSGIQDARKRDGQSLLDLIDGKNRKSPIYFESHYAELLGWNGLEGLIQDRWKLISTTRSELYDWEKDHKEEINLYSQREDVSQPLKSLLTRFTSELKTSSSQPDSETVEKLRSLGYVGTTNLAKSKGTADPKDKISIWAEYEKSLQLKNSGKTVEAQDILKSLSAQEPKNNFFRISLARSYRDVRNFKAAVEQLMIVVQNDPSEADAYQEMALNYKEQNKYEEALKAEEAALALNRNSSEFHALKGILLVETERFEEAKTEFLLALKTDPNNAVAWNNLGNALRETGKLSQAESAYKKAIELSPHYAYPLNGLATVLVRESRMKEALPYFEKALDLDPRFVEVYLNLGIAYHTLGETDKAKTLYKTFLKLAPDSMKKERENARLLLTHLP